MVNVDFLSKIVDEGRYTEDLGKRYMDIVRFISEQRDQTAEEREFIKDALDILISFANLGFRSSKDSQSDDLDTMISPRSQNEKGSNGGIMLRDVGPDETGSWFWYLDEVGQSLILR